MRIEYDCQSSAELFQYDIFASYSELNEYLKGAFEEPCSTSIWCEWNQSFEVDTTNYFTSDSLLREDQLSEFFLAHKDTSWGVEYYLASFKGYEGNVQAPITLLGYTNPPSSPNHPPDPKWSYIFVGDIPYEYYDGTYTKKRYVRYAVVHELAHQRAGLTHPGDYPQYHHATYPCVMHTMENITNECLNTIGFCWSNNPDDTTCRFVLRSYSR